MTGASLIASGRVSCPWSRILKSYWKKIASLGIELVDLSAAFEKSDIVVLLVNHRQFKNVDVACLKEKVVIDRRGL